MRINLLRIVVRLAFSALMTGNLTLRLADAHDQPLLHLQSNASAVNCLDFDASDHHHAFYSGVEGISQVSEVSSRPIGPLWTLALHASTLDSPKLLESWNDCQAGYDSLRNWTLTLRQIQQDMECLLAASEIRQESLIVAVPIPGKPPCPVATSAPPEFPLLREESYRPYDLSWRDVPFHASAETWTVRQDFCGPQPRDFYVTKSEIDANTKAQDLQELFGQPTNAAFCPHPEWQSSTALLSIRVEALEDIAYQAGQRLFDMHREFHDAVTSATIELVPEQKLEPFLRGPQFVRYPLEDGTEMLLDLSLARKWNLVRDWRASTILPNYCPLADYSRACVTQLLQRELSEGWLQLEAWGWGPSSAQQAKLVATAIRLIR